MLQKHLSTHKESHSFQIMEAVLFTFDNGYRLTWAHLQDKLDVVLCESEGGKS